MTQRAWLRKAFSFHPVFAHHVGVRFSVRLGIPGPSGAMKDDTLGAKFVLVRLLQEPAVDRLEEGRQIRVRGTGQSSRGQDDDTGLLR